MEKISAVVFDFGGVLMDWNPHYLYKSFFGNDHQKIDNFLVEIGFNQWNLQFDQGRPFKEGIAELTERFPAYRELIQAYDERWEESLGGPIKPTVDILRSLKGSADKKGFTLHGLTNWSAEKFEMVRYQYEFFNWFETIVVSGEEKLIKPDPRIFQVLLNKIHHQAQECLFIDDSPTNVSAAKNMGFDAIQFLSADQLGEELRQRRLLEPRSGK